MSGFTQPNLDSAAAHIGCAMRLQKAGRWEEAVTHWRRATELEPQSVQSQAALGSALRHLGILDEAIATFRLAVRLRPDNAPLRINLARALHAARRNSEAGAEFEELIRLDPKNPHPLNCYANMLAKSGHPTKAAAYYRAALELDPSVAEIHSNLGNVLKKQAKLDEAIACYEKTLAVKPEAWAVHSNLLMTLNSTPRSETGLLREHAEWAQRHAAKFYPTALRFANDRSPERRLRIGYVSPDFRRHSVSFFFEPILNHHDRRQFELFCYSNVQRPDDVTQSMSRRAEHWREINGISDEQTARLIQNDRIDVLVDLAGHTGNHRLLVFARRPAPVQATYLGYPNTTGLATMDYRITDEYSDPPGMTESHYVEQLVRLPRGFSCYSPPADTPGVRDNTSRPSGRVTFGSFNSLAKLTPEMIETWSRILGDVPNSLLLLKAEGLADDHTCDSVRAAFVRRGVAPHRIELQRKRPSFVEHLATYYGVDIALDTFPYHGTTTTCEALWMNVPVVTLSGRAHMSRVGVSLLDRVGLFELIARTADEYVAIACGLAHDAPRRVALATGLRERMRRSAVMDAAGVVGDLECAYRDMWRTWCAKSSRTAS